MTLIQTIFFRALLFLSFFFISASLFPSAYYSAYAADPSVGGHSSHRGGLSLTKKETEWLARHKTIRIAFDGDFPPYSFLNDAGEFEGLAVDIVRVIAEQLGVTFELYPDAPWNKLYEAAKKREVDVVATLVERPDRTQWFVFSKPYIYKSLVVMTRNDYPEIMDRKDLAGKTIALVKEYQYVSRILEEFPSLKPYYVDTMHDGLLAVSTGKADGAITFIGAGHHLMTKYQIANLKFAAIYDKDSSNESFGVRKDWPELASILNKALDSLSGREMQTLQGKWVPRGIFAEKPEMPELTKEEKAWIRDHPVIRLGIDPEFAPFEFIGENGVYSGIASDYVALLNQRLNLNMQVVPGLTWKEAVEKARARQIDVLPGVGITEERKAFLKYSEPYISFRRVIITRTETPFLSGIRDIGSLRVAVQTKSSHEGYLKDHTDIVPAKYDTLEQALLAVSDGKADAFVGNLSSSEFSIRELNLTNLKIAASLPGEAGTLHFAVRKDWPMLVSILNKGLASISPREKIEIRRRWVTVEYEPGIHPAVVRKYVLQIFGGALLVLGVTLFWNYRLKKEVLRRRKAEGMLKQARDHLEDRVSERTEELNKSNAELRQEIDERRRAEENLRLHENRLKALLELHRMIDAGEKKIFDSTLDACLSATKSSIAFLGLMSADETVLTIHAWSKDVMDQCVVADKPIHFPVAEAGLWGETVRQRRPIVVNDYIESMELKKGYPPGHIPLNRFLGVPIFKAEKIVAVAAVANKTENYTDADIGSLTSLLHEMWNLIEHGRSELLIRNILESIDEGFIIIDRDFRILSANGAYAHMVHMPAEQIVGRSCHEISHHLASPCFEDGHSCPSRKVFETGTPHGEVHTHLDSLGNVFYMELKSYPLSYDNSGNVDTVIETLVDITDKRKLETQLRQSQKMESVGTLAGGIAHDFNNILSAIIGYGSLALMKMAPDDPLRLNIEHILEASDRAAHLTKDLLLFSRKQVTDRKPADMNDIIRKVKKFLVRVISEDIECVTSLSDQPLTVLADSHQIEQVLMNLATNARDAMQEGGTFTIRTEQVSLDDAFVSVHGFGKAGTYVLMTVSDTGAGMDEETKSRIFEPFFTTKEAGKGTGLGLSVVYGIITQHEGFINVYSALGSGTTFRIYLPLLEAKQGEEEEKPTETLLVPGGTETVLMAEDDAALRKLFTAVLAEAGYRVITAEDGEDAVNKFMQHREGIRLCILDMIMPKKSGKEAYEEIKKLRPDIRVLFESGYTADKVRRERILEEGLDFIQKPVPPKDLLRKVREVLDRQS